MKTSEKLPKNDLPLVAIMGPTASGKTALAIKLARQLGGEIICADSRTVYREMNIGTAKPTVSERNLVPHHLLDLVSPGERFTTYDFQKLAWAKIAEIRARDKIPFLVGGSGLYVYSVIFDYKFDDNTTTVQSVNLRHSGDKSHAKSSELIDNCIAAGLNVAPETLRERIAARFSGMLSGGIIDEVKNLVDKYGENCPQLTRNLYGEIQKFLRQEISLEELKIRAKIVDWQLAKKQRTWFRQNRDEIFWESPEKVEEYLRKQLKTFREISIADTAGVTPAGK